MEILDILLLFGWVHLLFKTNRLSYEIKKLQASIPHSSADLAAQGLSPSENIVAPTSQNQYQNHAPVLPSPIPPATKEDTPIELFIAWLKEDFMVKLGAFLLLIGLGWFVSYAFANNWIGEMGRIMLGLITGVMIMAVGIWRIEVKPQQGSIFTVLGSATIILTLYAAREMYDLFTPVVALIMMFASVTFVAYVSVRYNRRATALAGLILAGFAPLLTASPTPDVSGLFLYLLVIVLGTLWVIYLRGWSILTLSALLLVSVYGIPYMLFGVGRSEMDTALMFSFIFTAIFFAANIVGLMFNDTDKNRTHHLLVALGTGIYLITWVLVAAAPEWQSLILSAWMLVFSFGSFLVYRSLNNLNPFYVYGATSVVLLAAATAMELDGPALMVAYIFEVTVLVILATKMFTGTKVPLVTSWLFGGLMLGSVASIDSRLWSEGVMHEDALVLVLLTAALFLVGFNFYLLQDALYKKLAEVFLVIASIYVLILIWLFLHAGIDIYDYRDSYAAASLKYQTATIWSLILYTLIGIATYIKGLRIGSRTVSLIGSILLGLVVARLLFVEVWDMDITGRIITFLVIGALLISTAFIKRNSSNLGQEVNSNNN